MATLKAKSIIQNGSSNQMAVMQLRWQQMRQFEFQPQKNHLPEPPPRKIAEPLYSAA